MEVIIAEKSNLIEITYLIYELTHSTINSKSNYIFCNSNKYPDILELETEINNKNVFILSNKRACVAAILLNNNLDISAKNIKWENTDENKFLVLDQILIHPYLQNKGLEKKIIDFAIEKAKEQKCATLRIKTNGNNKQYIDFCLNSGFKKTGEFFYPKQEIPFLCFEKIV